MTLQRKQTKKKEVVKLLDISIPSNILDVLLGYLLYYPQMDKEVATSIYYLFIKINRSLYIDNIYLELKFDLILFVSELIVKKNITSNKLIEGAIETKFITEYLEELDEVLDICHELVDPDNFKEADVNYIIEYINEKLMYIALYEEKENLNHLLHKLDVNDVDNFGEFGENFKNLLQKITKDIGNNINPKDTKLDYVFGTDTYDKSIKESLRELKSPSNKVVSGLQTLNKQINGGFTGGNVYLFLGASGNGKSWLLLQVLRWFMLYNQHIQPNNPRLKAIALYVTLENDIIESNERVFELFIPEDLRQGKDFIDYTQEEIKKLYRDSGWNDSDISFAIKYRKNKSINTADLELMIDKLEEEGYEVKILVLDYVKRIKAIDYKNDMRLDLGSIIDELVTLAKSKRIPIVTASQLNRDGISKLEELSKKSTNIVQELGTNNIGESTLMVENVTHCFIMYNETSQSTGKRYLTINKIKGRGKDNFKQKYFAYPYLSINSQILDEDYGQKKIKSIDNIADGLAEFQPGNNTNKMRTTRNLRKDSISAEQTIMYGTINDEKNFE